MHTASMNISDTFSYLKNSAKCLNVLLVEDDNTLRSEYAKFFTRIFESVEEATDGLFGLEKALQKPYDLIITDIMMPRLDGLCMVEKIKDIYPNQSVIVISAFHDETYLHKSVSIGVDGYIFKPLDMKNTLQVLHKVIAKILMEKENQLYKRNLEALVDIKSSEILKTYTTDKVSGLFSLTKLQEDIATFTDHSLCILKIKNFKTMNDFYGYEVGDAILLKTANFLTKTIFINPLLQDAKLYRLSGTHFAIFAPVDALNLKFEIEKIIKKFEATEIKIKDLLIYLEFHAGIVDRSDVVKLSFADSALRMSQENKKVFIYKHDQETLQAHALKLKCHNEIKRALHENRFVPFYHPIVDNATKTIVKYEALARMIMPDGEVVSPARFLPVSKKTKIYNKITVAIIQKALEDFRDSQCSISLNISFEDIEDKQTRDFILEQIALFAEPQRIIFELLESENIISFTQVKAFFLLLQSYGCKIAIDDFGSGYSNFTHLANLHIDYIKIDGSLISVLENDITSLAIVEMLSAFALKMQIKTIAEYVASDSLHKLVHSLGINESQGFIFGEPKPFNASMRHIQAI